MYRAKIAKFTDEDPKGLSLEDCPVFDLRRARRKFQEKLAPRDDDQ